MSDTRPTKEAMEAARKSYERIFGHAPVLSDDGANWWLDEIAAALDAVREKGWAKGYAAAINDCVTTPENQELAAGRERAKRIEENLKSAYRTADEAEDAYAVIKAERDAAIARAKAAEKLFHDEAETRATAEGLLQAAEERARVLEAALRIARTGLVRGPVDLAAMLDRIDAALAKAAAGQGEGGKE